MQPPGHNIPLMTVSTNSSSSTGTALSFTDWNLGGCVYHLATAGNDYTVKVWRLECNEVHTSGNSKYLYIVETQPVGCYTKVYSGTCI